MVPERYYCYVKEVAFYSYSPNCFLNEMLLINRCRVSVTSVAQLCPTLCEPVDCSMPGFPVLHYLPVCSNSYPLSQWCHPTISSSTALFSFCLWSFLASGSFSTVWKNRILHHWLSTYFPSPPFSWSLRSDVENLLPHSLCCNDLKASGLM